MNLNTNHENFVSDVFHRLSSGDNLNKRIIDKIAVKYSLENLTEIKELTELSIVRCAREICLETNLGFKGRFAKMVSLYNRQMILSHRTSQSIILQQYSTPCPIAFLASAFIAQNDTPNHLYFEPSAGNGLLTIALPMERTIVNEIDTIRYRNLQSQAFFNITKYDATEPFHVGKDYYSGIITNPPFGKNEKPVFYDGFKIDTLDHLMALRALDTLKPNGKAAIIIGGHSEFDRQGRIRAGKNRVFFSYLYKHYNVLDVINIDGGLYARQGTSFNVRLILIDGRKNIPEGFPPLQTYQSVDNYNDLLDRVNYYVKQENTTASLIAMKQIQLQNAKRLAQSKLAKLQKLNNSIDGPYRPASEPPVKSLDTMVPDSMDFEIHNAIFDVRELVGGSINDYVCRKLKYNSSQELANCLSAEQVDAVAMAIYNIEEKNQGMIIGDQTGIGKGRVAAAIIRYGAKNGLKPIFVTEKANLFSDIYRDLVAIGSEDLKPFIVNANESKTKVKDHDGNVKYEAPKKVVQDQIFNKKYLGETYDYVMMTYSQIASNEPSPKQEFISTIAQNNVMILDESHNAGGNLETSATARYFYNVVKESKGVIFLSATFAKRPDNMPLYAIKTCLQDAQITNEAMVEAIEKGGVALQEVLSASLVAEGQMMRRERTFEGIEVNYITLDKQGSLDYSVPDKEQEHRAVCNNITTIMQRIIAFQKSFVEKIIDEKDKALASQQQEADKRKGTSKMGVDNSPYFSKVFQVINQLLFAIKAEAVSLRAIQRLKEGKAPVIAFSSTMGSFLQEIMDFSGNSDTQTLIKTDFASVLKRGLDGILKYTVKSPDGTNSYHILKIEEFDQAGRDEYNALYNAIGQLASGISISPIDLIKHRIEQAGYSVAEVTGRAIEVKFTDHNCNQGHIVHRKKELVNDAFRKFNNNEVDVLMINQSGSTGASAHAVTTPKVSIAQVKQRVMIVLQAELDINREVQKRGRINRTGQIFKPIYDYISSSIPAEKRLMMMLQKKLKSLDANTTSNQKNSEALLKSDDFMNKYGDKLVVDYLLENPDIIEKLDDPLYMEKDGKPAAGIENAAIKVSGRIAVLSVEEQEHFYNDMIERYQGYVSYLLQSGEYDLEVEAMDLKSKTIEKTMTIAGKGGSKAFGGHTFLEKCEVNILKKPFSKLELSQIIDKNKTEINEKFPNGIKDELKKHLLAQFQGAKDKLILKFKDLIEKIPAEKKFPKDKPAQQQAYCQLREQELHQGELLEIKKLEKEYSNKYEIIGDYLEFFLVGRSLNFPYGINRIPAISLGCKINTKAKNPFAPSAIIVRIAMANSLKYIELNLASEQAKILNQIMGISRHSNPSTLENWDEICKQSSSDRGIRYIYTGNLLQAFGSTSKEDRAKLISYTTYDGMIKKGLLLPETFSKNESIKTLVPLNIAHQCILALTDGNSINASNNISFMKTNRGISIFTDGLSRQKFDNILTHDPLLRYIENYGGFQKVSDRWKGDVLEENIKEVCNIIYQISNCSVSLNEHQLEMVKHLVNQEPEEHIPVFPKLIELEIKLFALLKSETQSSSGLGMATIRDSFEVFKEHYPFQPQNTRAQIILEMIREIALKSYNFTNTTVFDDSPIDLRYILEKEHINPAEWVLQNKSFKRSETDVVRWVADELLIISNPNYYNNQSYEARSYVAPIQSHSDPVSHDPAKRIRLVKAKALAKLNILKLLAI